MTATDALDLIARSLLAAVFLDSAVSKLINWQAGLAEVRALGLPVPPLALAATVAVQGAGGLLLLLGWQAPWAAAALAAFTAAATLLAHPPWRLWSPGAQQRRTVFMEHLAIVGGLLMVTAHG